MTVSVTLELQSWNCLEVFFLRSEETSRYAFQRRPSLRPKALQAAKQWGGRSAQTLGYVVGGGQVGRYLSIRFPAPPLAAVDVPGSEVVVLRRARI